MNNEELTTELLSLQKQNTKESWTKAIELIKARQLKDNSKEDKKALKRLLASAEIGKVKAEIAALGENDNKEELNLRGKLISLYKKLERKASNPEEKYKVRHEIIEELKKHKATIKKMHSDKDTKISIPEKIALKVKDISDSISIFMKEKDVLEKVKNILKDSVKGAAGIVAITAAFSLATAALIGTPFTLSSLASLTPVIAYVGLTNIISNLSTKTPFEQYEYQQSDEFKALVKVFTEKHKEELEDIAKIIKQKNASNKPEDKVALNDLLVEKYDSLSGQTKTDALASVYKLQAYGCLQESKECCCQLKDEYLEGKNTDKEKYKAVNKKLMGINLEMWKRGNSIKESVKSAGKNFAISSKAILLARAIISAVAPGSSLAITNLKSVIESLLFVGINSAINIPTYQNKLKYKKTDYEGKVELENKARIEEILEKKSKRKEPKLSYA